MIDRYPLAEDPRAQSLPETTMIIHLRLFARARDLAGIDAVDVDVADGCTVADLRRRLAIDYPALVPLLERSAFAVANEFAEEARKLLANDEVALLPPVSGGAGSASDGGSLVTRTLGSGR